MTDLSVRIGDLTLANPIMPASGTLAEGLSDVFDLSRLGAIVTKTITDDLREGNPPPRVAELQHATLFSIGIPSKGANYYRDTTVPFYRRFATPIVASISADTVEQFGTLAAKVSVPGVVAIEANVSCPNLKKDGLAFGMDPQATAEVIAAMKRSTPLPIWAKLSPNVGDIAAIARAAEGAGADALVVANAMLAMAIDIESWQPRVANLMGGITGPATKPVILRMVYQCSQAVSIPIIGCGGISNAADAIEYLLAGASAVQVGTQSFVQPTAMIRLLDDLDAYCVRRGIKQVSELTGAMRAYSPEQMARQGSL
ncbi:dihydroorotate oxidase B, catalytic subunit [Sphingobium sp. AP50]|uniref:dihydroorotate dehydrogenase n=1 Tax=Sphingobium sp. AP50 TaxID=1884369 RepID=UPI0008D4E22A|nr:dihydroorotate dehydrogenase [Sphingobium sp. AP50]SEK00756.1 dihydroorotate oxidase B, catalytic subunit [Sphingobium sp. AP50]